MSEERKVLNVKDFSQCDKLVWSVAISQYYKYENRVAFTKLDKEDFYQTGWMALQDCINKGVDDLSYICTAMRNAMYRGVEKTSIIQTGNKKELWHYISGNECRLQKPINEDGDELADIILFTDNSLEDRTINRVLTQTIFDRMRDEDKEELIRIMVGLPPKRRRKAETVKRRALDVLEGRNPYRQSIAEKQSDVSGVTYDKSKDRWVFSKRIDGKVKKLKTSKDRSEVEKFAIEYYDNLKISV